MIKIWLVTDNDKTDKVSRYESEVRGLHILRIKKSDKIITT
jgi:hypothetical protein